MPDSNLAITQASHALSSQVQVGVRATLSRIQASNTVNAVATNQVIQPSLNVSQPDHTLFATGTVPVLVRTATLSRTQAAQAIAANANASTDSKTADLHVTQDNQQITLPALPPAYAVLSEAGGVVLSESGGIVYSEQWSPAPIPTTPNTPTPTTPLGGMISRLKAVLPTGWFPDSNTPILDGVLSGIATIWTALSDLLDYVTKQTRLATATDINLDVIASDYLGTTLPRRAAETDAIYRFRVQGAIFREMGTRAALASSLTRLTGVPPRIFEPGNATDTGGWGAKGSRLNTGMYYARAGGYGNYDLPFQAFILAKVVSTATGSGTQGYGRKGQAGFAVIGGYGSGSIQYTLLGSQQAGATDQDISEIINAVKPIGTIMWVSTEEGAVPDGPTTPPVTTAVNGRLTKRQDNQTILGPIGVSPVAGLNVTQANHIVTATGTTGNVVGTLSRVQANQTVVSTVGDIPVAVAGLNVTQSSHIVTATGTSGNVVGTLSRVQANQTVVSTAGGITVAVAGLNITQSNHIVTATGTTGNVVGTLAAVQTSQALFSTIGTVTLARLSTTQANHAATITGTTGNVVGTLTAVQANQTVVSTVGGITVAVAGLNVTQANHAATITGTTGNVVGTLALAQANQTVVSTAGNIPVAVAGLNITQANQTATATGTTGNVVATLGRVQTNQTLLGSVGANGVGALNVGQDDQVANISGFVGNVPLPDSTPLLDATFILDTSKLS